MSLENDIINATGGIEYSDYYIVCFEILKNGHICYHSMYAEKLDELKLRIINYLTTVKENIVKQGRILHFHIDVV